MYSGPARHGNISKNKQWHKQQDTHSCSGTLGKTRLRGEAKKAAFEADHLVGSSTCDKNEKSKGQKVLLWKHCPDFQFHQHVQICCLGTIDSYLHVSFHFIGNTRNGIWLRVSVSKQQFLLFFTRRKTDERDFFFSWNNTRVVSALCQTVQLHFENVVKLSGICTCVYIYIWRKVTLWEQRRQNVWMVAVEE